MEKLLNNRVVIRVTKNDTKSITKDDGTVINLITRVEFKDDTADDAVTLKNVGVVEHTCDDSELLVGDKVWFDPALMGNGSKFFDEQPDYTLVWTFDKTTYHKKDDYYYDNRGRKRYNVIKGEIYDETQVYAVERDGEIFGYDTWHLFELPKEVKSYGGIFLKEDVNNLHCIADSIGSGISLKGKECLINIDGGTIMYIEIMINGKNYAVASIEDIVATIDVEAEIA